MPSESYDWQSEPWLSMPQGRCAARNEQVHVRVVSDGPGWPSRLKGPQREDLSVARPGGHRAPLASDEAGELAP